MRTCIGCRRVAVVSELVRFHRTRTGLALGGGPGRGAWLCAQHAAECLDRATRRRAIDRALRATVDRDEVRQLHARLESEQH
ncbi:MAG: YlxR family protein [Acidimicrobiia bacterium]